MIYFTDVYKDVIMRGNIDGTDIETVVSEGLSTMDGIAVDWIANNLFWTDAGTKSISVARLNGEHRY